MSQILSPLALCSLVLVGLNAVGCSQRATPIIFDTDIGGDIDDCLALGVIHGLLDRGEVDLLAVTVSKDEPWSVPLVDAINTYYGRPDIPIGMVRPGVCPEPSNHARHVADARENGRLVFPHDLKSGADAPEAVGLLRRTLAEYPRDGEIVMVVVGPATNAARLAESPPDDISPLDGKALLTKKVKLLSIMAGNFSAHPGKEFNVVSDLPASKRLWPNWPTPIVASGFEIGEAIPYPGGTFATNFAGVGRHPVREAYEAYAKMPYDRPSWDLTSVIQAVRPGEGYFDLSPAGRITVDAEGVTHFTAEPGGQHRYLIASPEQCERVKAVEVELVKPRAKGTP